MATERKLTYLQLISAEPALKRIAEDKAESDDLTQLVAIYLAGHEALKAAQLDPEALRPHLDQAEGLDPEEVGEIVGFFIQKHAACLRGITSGVPARTIAPPVKRAR